jgi:hypothetical protein
MFLTPTVAVLAMLRVAVTVVGLTTRRLPADTLTPVPSPVNPVVPVRLVPVRVTGTPIVPVAGWVATAGEIAVRVAPCTVKGRVLVFPIGVVTPMFLIPTVAVLAIVRFAVSVVPSGETVIVPATSVTPPPSPVNAVAPVRFAPVKVTGTEVVPVAGRVTAIGLIPDSVAPRTVKATPLLAAKAPGTVTVTFLAVSAAPAVMVKVA